VTLKLIKLTDDHIVAYEDFLQACPLAMMYHSLTYRRFLKHFLPSSAEDHYLLVFEGNQIVGVLPCFLIDGPYGAVVNSLPFFGSHGSILLHPNANNDVTTLLTEGLMNLCHKHNVSFTTVIDTPFSSNERIFMHNLSFQFCEHRIGQITMLPEGDVDQKVSESLMLSYHSKTRNHVRKGLKSGLVFGHDDSQQTLRTLFVLHEENMLSIGSVSKPIKFFNSISSQMIYDNDYRIYTARTHTGKIVSAVLLLYFKDYVEYFCPATLDGWRVMQPLSALIYLAMLDSVLERKARKWNWGGTWLNQKSVYHFKSRWGTSDYPYRYYTRVLLDENRLSNLSRQELLDSYKWFYTVPFSVLEQVG
jgi:hypothetical protein